MDSGPLNYRDLQVNAPQVPFFDPENEAMANCSIFLSIGGKSLTMSRMKTMESLNMKNSKKCGQW